MTWRIVTMLFVGTAAAAGGGIHAREPVPAEIVSAAKGPAAQLGKQIFFDPGLSASGQLACASCHSPAHAFTSPGGGAAPPGGPHLNRAPLRAVPSLRYLGHTPRFTRHYYVDSGAEREDEGPAGGFMLDGRADRLSAQALLPWMDPAEMANANVVDLSSRLRRAGYAERFRRLFGAAIFDRPGEAVAAAALALERFELDDAAFHPYTSRYDRFVAGKLRLSDQEMRGLRLFVDPLKGNCAECHPNSPGPGGRPADFTDYAYRALGVPRNRAVTANSDPNFYDLGLCGPRRSDLRTETQYCGYFKTPTLRNAARRRVFFHNGRFTTLKQVLQFYAERDSAPGKWYPSVRGRVRAYDDLPVRYRDRVDISDPPFNRGGSDAPLLSAPEIEDLIAFLKTLDDAD